jgi:hypothetical protein
MGIDANSRGLGSLKIRKIFGDLKMTGWVFSVNEMVVKELIERFFDSMSA